MIRAAQVYEDVGCRFTTREIQYFLMWKLKWLDIKRNVIYIRTIQY